MEVVNEQGPTLTAAQVMSLVSMRAKPRRNNLVVLPFIRATRSTLIDTAENREYPEPGLVLQCGPGAVGSETGQLTPVDSVVGEIVWFDQYAGKKFDANGQTRFVKVFVMPDDLVLLSEPSEGLTFVMHDEDPSKTHLADLTCEHCPTAKKDEAHLHNLQSLAYGEPGDVLPAEDESARHRTADAMPDAGGPSALIEQERERLRQERAQRERGDLPPAGRVVPEEHNGTIEPVE